MAAKTKLYPFVSLLQNVPMLNFFDRFLQENFSGENLSFWFEVESYKSLPDEHLPEKAKDLYFRYLKSGSISEINVDCELKAECKRALEKAGRDLFSVSQQAIYEVMQTDSYPKFLRSETYQLYLQEHAAPTIQECEEDRTPLVPCPWTWFCYKVPTPNMKIQSICVSNTGPFPKVWTSVSDGRLVTWKSSVQALNAEKLSEIQTNQKRINSIVSIGQMIWAVSDDSTVTVWNAETEAEATRIQTQAGLPLLTVVSNKNQTLAFVGSASGDIFVFDAFNFTQVSAFKIPGPAISIHDDGENVWVGSDHLIHLLNSKTFEEEMSFHAHDRSVKMIIESLGRFWTCSENEEIFVWAKNHKQVSKVAELRKHQGRVTTLYAIQDTVWSGSFDSTICVWDAQTFDFLQHHKGTHSDSIRCLTQVSDGVVWVSSFDRNMSIWHYYDHSATAKTRQSQH